MKHFISSDCYAASDAAHWHHVPVGDHEIEFAQAKSVEILASVCCLIDVLEADLSKKDTHDIEDHVIVVDDENRFRSKGGHLNTVVQPC